jgi:hypothetical protein
MNERVGARYIIVYKLLLAFLKGNYLFKHLVKLLAEILIPWPTMVLG